MRLLNPKILGIRLSMLLYLYRRRLRAHPAGELLAGAGVAIGVALVFGVLLANASLTGAAVRKLIHGLAGSARYALRGRSAQGFDERTAAAAGRLSGVQVAAPVLRENVTLHSPRGAEAVQLIGVTPSLEALGGVPAQELEAGGALLESAASGCPPGWRARSACTPAIGSLWRATATQCAALRRRARGAERGGGAGLDRRAAPWRSRCSKSPRRSPGAWDA